MLRSFHSRHGPSAALRPAQGPAHPFFSVQAAATDSGYGQRAGNGGFFAGCAVCLVLATTTHGASAVAQAEPVQSIELGNGVGAGPAPLHTDRPAAPAAIRAAGSGVPDRIVPTSRPGQSSSLRPPDPAAAGVAAEIARLRTVAEARTRRGSAAEKAAGRAAWTLGLVYLHGAGVASDRAQARVWFDRAYAAGEPLAAAGLAWCAIDGCEEPPSPAAARPWIARLRKDSPGTSLYLEWLLENRLAPVQVAQPQRLGQAPLAEPTPHREMLVRAAQSGEVNAQIELAFEQLNAGRMADAAAQFRAAAPRSAAAASNAELMARRESMPVVAQGRQTAETWLAAARRYHRGEGVPANFAEALRLYQLAASEGSAQAKRMLGLVYSRPAPGGQIDLAWMRQLADVDLSREMVQLNAPSSAAVLRREPTPLYQFLPPSWKTPG